jgi:hypothetical protein
MGASPSLFRIWAPLFLSAMMFFFLQHMKPVYWLFALPVFPIVIFMLSLAEIHDEGSHMNIRLSWKSIRVPKEDILSTTRSFLDGIGVLRLRHFVFPWGHVYFVDEWSTMKTNDNSSHSTDSFFSALLAISGFVAAHAGGAHSFRIVAFQGRALALVSAGLFSLIFFLARTRAQSFANFLLFAATYIVGLVNWST